MYPMLPFMLCNSHKFRHKLTAPPKKKNMGLFCLYLKWTELMLHMLVGYDLLNLLSAGRENHFFQPGVGGGRTVFGGKGCGVWIGSLSVLTQAPPLPAGHLGSREFGPHLGSSRLTWGAPKTLSAWCCPLQAETELIWAQRGFLFLYNLVKPHFLHRKWS